MTTFTAFTSRRFAVAVAALGCAAAAVTGATAASAATHAGAIMCPLTAQAASSQPATRPLSVPPVRPNPPKCGPIQY